MGNVGSQMKSETQILTWGITDYRDACIIVKRTVTTDGYGPDTVAIAADKIGKSIAFNNSACFAKCITKINDKQIDK